jgi:molybdopterin converting factor subunit 1
MRVKLLFFASFKDRVGRNSVELDLPAGALVADLKAQAAEQFPALKGLIGAALVSVNQQFAFDEDALEDGAEAALFPPVSGGGRGPVICQITEDSIDLDGLVAQIRAC